MNCKQVENNLLFYIDNELSEEMSTSIYTHINACEHCMHLHENLKSTFQLIEKEKIQPDDFYFYTRLQQRMENQSLKGKTTVFLQKRILQPIAVFCLLTIGIFAGIKIGNQYNTNNIEISAESNRISQLNAYSEESFIAEINDEKIVSLITSNQ